MPPTSIEILDESSNPLKNGTTVGPLREGQHFSSTCIVRGSRPAPLVGWYRAGKRLKGMAKTRTTLPTHENLSTSHGRCTILCAPDFEYLQNRL